MAKRKAKNGEKCSCCKRSSSSSSSSSSGSSSGSGSDSSSGSESQSFSDSRSGSGSGSDSTAIGKCCAINPDYVIESETFEESGQTGESKAREWLADKRGSYRKGFTYHGPIQLLGGGFFAAVICLGTKKGDDCDCYTEQADQQGLWLCSDGVDESYCYNLGGVPGTGVLTPGEECECTGSAGCKECTDEAPPPCETGCEECSCCWSERTASGEPGTVCMDSYVLYSYETIMRDFPEILSDSLNNCSTNPNILSDPIEEWNAWHYFLEGVLAQGFIPKLVFYNSGTGVNNGNYWEDRLDANGELVQGCVIDIWANERPSCDPYIFKQPGWEIDGGAPLINGWEGTNKRPACLPSEAIDGITCWDSARFGEIGESDRGTLDCDVANQLGAGSEWSPLEGDNAGGCSAFSCSPECDQDLMPQSIPPGEGEKNPIYWEIETPEAFSFVFYYLQRGTTPPVGFVWPDGWPDEIGVGGTDWYWYEERLDIQQYANLDGSSIDFTCIKWTLAVCNRESKKIEDQTPACGTIVLPIGNGETVEVDRCDFQFGVQEKWNDEIQDFEYTLAGKPDLGEGGETVPECGQALVDVFPIDLPEKEYPGCGGSFRDAEEGKEKNMETRALPSGPGTELKKLLKIFGLPDRPGCKCNKRAKTMDSWGPDKCSEPERLTEIIGWLKEEAVKQKVPFVEWAARVIVKRAIRNARKAK
ncbi:MAG: hypothetical protein HOH94_16710 [Verrucomicrobia bacterium]|nr:hypothetical protein [Verrucomicrobiota bacterium]